MKNLKTIIISPGNSGGGAVFEYLASRDDFVSPFKFEEYRMVGDPDGLYDLYLNCYKHVNIYSSSLAIKRFLKYNSRINSLKVKSHNKKVKLVKNGYNDIVLQFINKISKIEYSSNPQFYKMRLNNLDKTKIFINEKIDGSLSNKRPFRVIIPKDKKIFIKESIKLLNKIILNNLNSKILKKNIVIDQGANIFNPEESSMFYDNRKLIIVTRDPRSIFYSMKRRKSYGFPGYDIKIFVKWYEWITNNIYKKKSNKVMHINFEDFILNKNKNISNLEQFLNLKKLKNERFDFESSKKNILKAKKFLDKNELKYIEKKLKKYLVW